ncbi:MAG TPA: hypothetical protein VJ694_00180 [Patescibacteria group bacterium]|nr:hypothetical protein [Patescibacteria group bacterium]
MTDPDTIASAVLNHVETKLPPTDAEVFDGVPTALPDEITERVIIPQNVNDDDWDEDAETVVRKVPALRGPVDPTGCMM